MEKLRSFTATAALFFLGAPLALAAGGGKSYVSLALTRVVDESQADTAKAKNEVFILNLTGAWVQASGLSLGLKYFDFTQNGQILSSASGTVIQGFGPLIGYYHPSGFFGNFSYLYKPTKKVNDAARAEAETLKDGDGYVIDLGKAFELGGFGVAVQVSYSKVTYKKAEIRGLINEVDLDGNWYDSSTYPYIAGLIYF